MKFLKLFWPPFHSECLENSKYPELSITYTTVFKTDMAKKHDHVACARIAPCKTAVDSGFQVLDSGFSVIWILDSNC